MAPLIAYYLGGNDRYHYIYSFTSNSSFDFKALVVLNQSTYSNTAVLSFLFVCVMQDFKAIGIDKRGYRLRLLGAAAKLPSFSIYVDVPVSVAIEFPIAIYNYYCYDMQRCVADVT